MHTIAELIDSARVKSGIPSDNQLAPHLGVSRAAVSQWRNGTNVPRDEHALELARLAGLPDDYVLLCVHAATATHPEAKKVLRQVAGKLRRTAAAVTLGIAGLLGFSHAPPARAASVDSPSMYIMENHALGAGTPSTPAPAVILHLVPRSAPERHVVGS